MSGLLTPCASRDHRFAWTALAVFVVLAVSGCVSSAPAESSPQGPQASEQVESKPRPQPDEDYRMRFGDVLEIRFFYNPELDAVVPIRPDGRISLELVGEVVAAGLTPQELNESLRSSYADKLRNPEVTVMLTTFSERRIFVGGEVQAPRAIELGRELTAFQAIVAAGGFKSTAHLANVIVLRDQGTSEPLFFKLDYKQVVKKGELDPGAPADMMLQPNDIVFVPKTRVARWGQLVDQYFTQLVPISLNMGLTYFAGSLVN